MSTNAIDVDGITVRYGDFVALDDVSFSVPAGAFCALIGPNGAGKSTLLNVLLGLQPRQAGHVQFFGAEASTFPRQEIGYIPQLKTLDRSFPARAIELVVSGMRRSWPWRISADERERALAAMAMAGVDGLAWKAVAQLSGGELQRVYLARSLVRRPRLLILDEPGAGMDMAGEAAMYHILGDYQHSTGATVLMITHDWEGARYHASLVLLLNRRVIGFGAPREVASDANLLQLFGHTGHVQATHGGGHVA